MRFSTVSVALLAGAVAAAPQVQPISQISDGQIQAPPATPPAGYSASVVVPVPSAASSALVAPSAPPASAPPASPPAPPASGVPTPTATPVGPLPSVVVPIVPGVNSTAVLSSTAIVASSTAAGSSGATSTGVAGSATTTSGLPEATGAASANAISFGGLVVAMAAAVFA